jgi:DNA-directed RNA polymerase specialized sigma24 family protein
MNGAPLHKLDSADRTTAAVDDVVSAAQAGSAEAFRKLHVLYSRRLYKTIVAIMKNPQGAEDALQDTFLRAYLAIDRFEGRSNIYSWLTRIAINSAIMILRKRSARAEVLFPRHTALTVRNGRWRGASERGSSKTWYHSASGPASPLTCTERKRRLS